MGNSGKQMSHVQIPNERTLYVWEDGNYVLTSMSDKGKVIQYPNPNPDPLDLYLILRAQSHEGTRIVFDPPPYLGLLDTGLGRSDLRRVRNLIRDAEASLGGRHYKSR